MRVRSFCVITPPVPVLNIKKTLATLIVVPWEYIDFVDLTMSELKEDALLLDQSTAILAFLKEHGFRKSAKKLKKELRKRYPDQTLPKRAMGGEWQWIRHKQDSREEESTEEVTKSEDDESDSEEESSLTPDTLSHASTSPHLSPPRPTIRRSVSFDDTIDLRLLSPLTPRRKAALFYQADDLRRFKAEDRRRKQQETSAQLASAMSAASATMGFRFGL